MLDYIVFTVTNHPRIYMYMYLDYVVHVYTMIYYTHIP